MEREITREHGGQKEGSLETKPPQAKVISNAQISQRVERVSEIMDVILIISFFSGLGPPLVFQPRPLLGGQLGQKTTGNGKTL